MVLTSFTELVSPAPNPWDTQNYPVTELPGLPQRPHETAVEYIARASAVLADRRRVGLVSPAPATANQPNVSAVFAEIGQADLHQA